MSRKMNLLRRCWCAVAIVGILFSACEHHDSSHQHVMALISESEQMVEQENVDSAWGLLNHAFTYARDSHDGGSMSEALLAMARLYNMVDSPDSAIATLHRGLDIFPAVHDSLLAQYYAELSATYNIIGDMRQSVDYGLLALPLMRQYGSKEDVAVVCGNIGISYRRLGKNDSSAILYRQGLEVAMQAEDAGSQAYLSNNLSVLYAEMGRCEESISYAEKAVDAARQVGDDIEQLSAQANKGIALLLSGKAEKAIELLTQTFAQADSTSSTRLKLKIINYLLKALMEQKQWATADHYLARGEELAAQLPEGGTASAGILEAKMIVQTEQGKYTDALETIAQLEQLMQQQQVIPRYKLLANKGKCLASLGRYKEAYALQLEASVQNDSIKSREVNEKLDRLTTDYRVMEKELEVSRLNERQTANQHKISVLLFLLLMVLLLLAVLLFYLRNRRQQALMRETSRYVDGMEQERARFARELHDGACNELLSVGMQLRALHPDILRITQQIATLRTHLRNLSHELMPPSFTKGVHLDEALAHYISHIENVHVDFHAEGTGWELIPANVAYQYYRIAQEAIGNVIVHQEQARAEITLSYRQPHLQLCITSQGKMLPGDGSGIGMQSVSERANSIQAMLTTLCEDNAFTLRVDYGTP